MKPIVVLGIESSCDESAVSLLALEEPRAAQVLGEVISSQVDLHAKYGGVVPELASREHLRNLPLLLDQVMTDAGIGMTEIDAIAVTQGPGLKGCLLSGLTLAKGMCVAGNVPLIGVNHIEGHILALLLDNPGLEFPYLCLVVSGGHTEILLVEDFGKYRLLARTIDDAAGEAFDKSANLLGLAYPGGARLARLADSVEASEFVLPKVMRESEDFSFSGLKTAISLLIKKQGIIDEQQRARLAFSIQQAIIDTLLHKLRRAISETGVTRIGITGGVSANVTLRRRAGEIPGAEVFVPRADHCMDNAAMIAYCGAVRFQRGERSPLSLDVKSRWPVESI